MLARGDYATVVIQLAIYHHSVSVAVHFLVCRVFLEL